MQTHPEINAGLSQAVAENQSTSSSSSLSRVAAVASNAFREAIRDRVLYNLVLFALILTGAAVFLGDLSASQEAKLIVDMGLSAMLLFGVFISVFVGVGLVYKEIERRTIYSIFSKPVSRAEFLVGKYLGLCLTLLLNVAVMTVGVAGALAYAGRGPNGFAPMLLAAALIYLELVMVVSIAILLSSFSTPTLSALLSIGFFLIGNYSVDMKAFADSMGGAGAKFVFTTLYYLLPNFSKFSFITQAAHGLAPTGAHIGLAALYAALYSAAMLAIASAIFSRRNFK